MKKKVLSFSLLATALLSFGAVGASGCSTAGFSPASIKLNVDSLTLGLGQVEQLKLTLKKGYSGEVRWFTSNEGVASVEDGYVFGVGLGTATVTAAYAGGYADCVVTVTPDGGGEAVDRLSINPTSKRIGVGESFTIKTSVYPADTKVTFTSSSPAVASVDASKGVVAGLAEGTASITVSGDNGKTAVCNVTVTKEGGSDPSGRDIAVDDNLGYTGKLTIGSPLIQTDFMKGLLDDFNKLTNSKIEFTVTKFEEDNGTSGYPNAQAMPAVFPYASDQTLALRQFGALSDVSKTDYNWIKQEMGDEAYKAARLTSCVGYPFAADNGVVMFYNTDIVTGATEEERLAKIDTWDEIVALAGDKYVINFAIGNGFYAAGSLMTYSGGESFYSLTPNDISYKSESHFNCAEGIQAGHLIWDITQLDCLRNATSAPKGTAMDDPVVTITDVSKVRSFKTELGSKYAVAPLPYIDSAMTTRLGSFLGYKFYGVNNQLSKDDKEKAAAVAKFLCSEYAQVKRFDEYQVRPTILDLQDYAASEPHIAALTKQQASHSTIPLTAIASEFWSETATTILDIKALTAAEATDVNIQKILKSLDSKLTK